MKVQPIYQRINLINCDAIVYKNSIQTMKQVITYHNSNPAIMKEVNNMQSLIHPGTIATNDETINIIINESTRI